MKMISHKKPIGLPALLGVAAFLSGCAQEDALQTRIARGAHLVNNVALCQDCHSPRLPDGQFDQEQWLTGSRLGFAPTMEMPWSPVAPSIAGLPTLNDEEALVFLTTGGLPGERSLRPPMPAYRFTQEEAGDVIAYLRSLSK